MIGAIRAANALPDLVLAVGPVIDGVDVMAALIAGEAWVMCLLWRTGGWVDREQWVDVGECGDPVLRPAGPNGESHLSASGGGFAVGLQQMPDG